MNYNEFPIIKEKYTPICLEEDRYDKKVINPFIETKIVEVIKEVFIEPLIEIEDPVYMEELSKKKKSRKKKEFFNFPADWSEELKSKYRHYYYRCRQKGKNFSLTFEEFENFFKLSCKFCGSNENMTIDRIDSKIGYELFNCQPCCNKCNVMKHFLTEYDFLDKVSQIYHYQIDR